VTGQAAAVVADIERMRDAFDFTKNGLDLAVAGASARGIDEQMDSQADPDGTPWEPLSERYDRWKQLTVGGLPMAELFHVMKTIEQLTGSLEVSRDRMVQTYGVTEEARQEAYWFQDPQGDQPPRRFYELNAAAIDHVTQVLDDRFADAIR
jgi:hypothetical protein